MTNINIDVRKILDKIQTKYELLRFIEEIDILLGSSYQKDGIDKVLSEKVRVSTGSILREIIMLNKGNETSTLVELKKILLTIPEVKISIAFEPNGSFVAKVYDYFTKSLQENLLIDLNIERELIGGAIVSYRGIYGDYTVRRVLINYFTQNK